MQKIKWVDSGVVEDLDKRQVRLHKLVFEKIQHYYDKLFETKPCYDYPLSLHKLMKLTKRSSYQVTLALKYLANTIPVDSKRKRPLVFYRRISAEKNASHRPYQIFVRP